VKMKNPWYLNIHKLLGLVHINGVIDMILSPTFNRADIPPEIEDRFDDIYAYVMLTFANVRDAAISEFKSIPTSATDRKSKALWILANATKHLQSLLFMQLDGKDITSAVWKIVRTMLADEQKAQVD